MFPLHPTWYFDRFHLPRYFSFTYPILKKIFEVASWGKTDFCTYFTFSWALELRIKSQKRFWPVASWICHLKFTLSEICWYFCQLWQIISANFWLIIFDIFAAISSANTSSHWLPTHSEDCYLEKWILIGYLF